MELRGLTALITGASSGIGEEFSRQLAKEGVHVILTARDETKLKALASDLEQQYAVQADVEVADLSIPGAAEKLYERLTHQGKTVDLLINNAGFGVTGFFHRQSAEVCRSMVEVNVSSLVVLSRLFLPAMLERRRGGMINIASTASFQPLPFLNLYSATKAFVRSFTEALWGEYRGRGVRILCLCPGNTVTDFHRRAGIERKRVFFAAKCSDLVSYGLHAFKYRNGPTAVHGFLNKILAQGHRLFPTEVILAVARLIYKQPSK